MANGPLSFLAQIPNQKNQKTCVVCVFKLKNEELYFTHEKNEAQRRGKICIRSQSKWIAELKNLIHSSQGFPPHLLSAPVCQGMQGNGPASAINWTSPTHGYRIHLSLSCTRHGTPCRLELRQAFPGLLQQSSSCPVLHQSKVAPDTQRPQPTVSLAYPRRDTMLTPPSPEAVPMPSWASTAKTSMTGILKRLPSA